jgi:hypothetical protein
MEKTVPSRLYLGCIWKDFSETPNFPLKAKDLRFLKDGYIWSSLRGTLLGKQFTFSALSRLK